MSNLFKEKAKAVVRRRARAGRTWPLPQLCARATRDLFPGLCTAEQPLTMLALAHHRFMPDLRALARTSGVRVLGFPLYWHFAAPSWFRGDYWPPDAQRHQFLEHFMRAYLPLVGARCVVGTAFWYRQDLPWGAAAEANGVPYVVFHKESYKPTPAQQDVFVQRAAKVGHFPGSHLVVHNEPSRELLVRSGIAPAERISALGFLRMDPLVAAARSHQVRPDGQPTATLFSFTPGIGLDDLGVGQWPKDPGVGWVKLFEETHVTFARFAQAHPEVTCVIKAKWGDHWFTAIEAALAANGITLSDIPNLRLTCEDDPHDLMMRSRVVCGFNSTTLLEAGILGIPVIVPNFAEATDPRYAPHVKLAPHGAFDVAISCGELSMLLEHRLTNPSIEPPALERRRALFETWVSRLDGPAAPRYLDLLRKLCARSGSAALHPTVTDRAA